MSTNNKRQTSVIPKEQFYVNPELLREEITKFYETNDYKKKDTRHLMSQMKTLVLNKVVILFSSVIPLGVEPMSYVFVYLI